MINLTSSSGLHYTAIVTSLWTHSELHNSPWSQLKFQSSFSQRLKKSHSSTTQAKFSQRNVALVFTRSSQCH